MNCRKVAPISLTSLAGSGWSHRYSRLVALMLAHLVAGSNESWRRPTASDGQTKLGPRQGPHRLPKEAYWRQPWKTASGSENQL
jgi:hypothetical protein